MKKITTVEQLFTLFKSNVARKRAAGLSLDQAEIAAKTQIEHDVQYAPDVLDPEVGRSFLSQLRIGPGSRSATTAYGIQI